KRPAEIEVLGKADVRVPGLGPGKSRWLGIITGAIVSAAILTGVESTNTPLSMAFTADIERNFWTAAILGPSLSSQLRSAPRIERLSIVAPRGGHTLHRAVSYGRLLQG